MAAGIFQSEMELNSLALVRVMADGNGVTKGLKDYTNLLGICPIRHLPQCVRRGLALTLSLRSLLWLCRAQILAYIV